MQLDERYYIGENALKFLRISNHQLLGFNMARNTENKNSVSVLTSFVWNEDGVYKYYGGGSGLALEEYDNLVNTINAECNVEK